MTRAPRITDPRSVPVVGIDDHLVPITPAALEPQALRERFGAATEWTPEWPGDGMRFIDREPAAAAVLVPLVMAAMVLDLWLRRQQQTRRGEIGLQPKKRRKRRQRLRTL